MNDEASIPYVSIYLNGKNHRVPADLTIVDAMEYAGFRLLRGIGCRQGMCGACVTLYRLKGDYKLRGALACQEPVQDDMYILMVPYTPANKALYDFREVKPSEKMLVEYYPEIAKCISCNTCTKACPQDLEVLEYVQSAIRGDFKKISELSFECIECGLCAIRCPAEIVPYYVARLARRVYARDIVGLARHVEKRCRKIEEERFDEELEKISKTKIRKLKVIYNNRDFL